MLYILTDDYKKSETLTMPRFLDTPKKVKSYIYQILNFKS